MFLTQYDKVNLLLYQTNIDYSPYVQYTPSPAIRNPGIRNPGLKWSQKLRNQTTLKNSKIVRNIFRAQCLTNNRKL